jgi:hypothetical protein
MNNEERILKSLEEIENLIRIQLIIELNKVGMPQASIAKKLHIAIKTINDLLKEVKKNKN